MRKRALMLCLENWKMAIVVALSASLTSLVLSAAGGLLRTIGLAGIPFLGTLLTTIVFGGLTILLYPLAVGEAYILLNLWQCKPTSASQLFTFFRNPALRNQVWVMAAIVVLIQNGLSLVSSLLAELLGSSPLGTLLLVPINIVFICITVFVSMRFFMVPVLFLADPSLSAPECPKASYNLMRGHCWNAFGFTLVTILYLLPVIIAFAIVVGVLVVVASAPSLAAGNPLALTSSPIVSSIGSIFAALLTPFLVLCSTAFSIERVMGHPQPAPANRFQPNL